MNINAKQVTEIATSRFDITTVLGFFGQIKNLIAANTGLTANLSTVWTSFTAAYTAFDDAYAQARRWVQTEDIAKFDTERDDALSAFLTALKALLTSPNQAKQLAAKRLLFIRDKYNLNTGDEYMKETTAVAQMIQEMEATQQPLDDLDATGLDDWFADLKAKNEAFLDSNILITGEQHHRLQDVCDLGHLPRQIDTFRSENFLHIPAKDILIDTGYEKIHESGTLDRFQDQLSLTYAAPAGHHRELTVSPRIFADGLQLRQFLLAPVEPHNLKKR